MANVNRLTKVFIISVLLIVNMANNLYASSTAKLMPHRGMAKDVYNFWLYLPENYDQTQSKTPLIVFLHGRSLCGNDLNRVKRYGLIDAVESGRRIDAVIIAPQCPSGSWWQPEKVHETIQWVKDRYRFDADRVYVMGMSLGGYGTIDYCATYPDEVAAGIGMCGGATVKPNVQQQLTRMPFWIVHGTADAAVPISESKKVVNNILDAPHGKDRLQYTWLAGGSHGAPARMFYHPDTYKWLFSHRISDKGRPINRSFNVSMESLKNAYRMMNRGEVKCVQMTGKNIHKLDATDFGDEEEESEEMEEIRNENEDLNNSDDFYFLPTPEQVEKELNDDEIEEDDRPVVVPAEPEQKKSDKPTNVKAEENSVAVEPEEEEDVPLKSDDDEDEDDKPEVAGQQVEKTIKSERKEAEQPKQQPVKKAKPTATYTVQKGDNLYRIALNHGVSLDALLDANKLTREDKIRVGQVLIIP